MKKIIVAVMLLIILTVHSQTVGLFEDSRDGKEYYTVKIGTQTWMAENLAYKAYPGCLLFKNNYLYDWETAMKAAPEGWHIPSVTEWEILIKYLGGKNVAGGKMKEAGFDHWKRPNYGATNESGFTALPGGYRDNNKKFLDEGYGFWWCSNEMGVKKASAVEMYCGYSTVFISPYEKEYGFSIRCVKD